MVRWMRAGGAYKEWQASGEEDDRLCNLVEFVGIGRFGTDSLSASSLGKDAAYVDGYTYISICGYDLSIYGVQSYPYRNSYPSIGINVYSLWIRTHIKIRFPEYRTHGWIGPLPIEEYAPIYCMYTAGSPI